MSQTLGGFHHRVAKQLTETPPQHQPGGIWNYRQLIEAMREEGLEEIEVYIWRYKNIVAQ